MRLLQRLRKHRHRVGNLDVFPVIAERLLVRPGLEEHLEGLKKFLSGFGYIAAKAAHFVGLVTAPHPAHEAAVNEIVEHGDLFGQAQGLPDRQNDRGSPDANASRALTDVQRLHERRWRVTVIAEMVLGNEAIIEPERLRVLDLLHTLFEEQLPIAQSRVWPLVEQSKLHRAFPWCSASRWSASLMPLPC